MRVERNTTHDALHAIGATRVVQVGPGVFEVEPDIDVTLLDQAEIDTRKSRLLTYTKSFAGHRIVARLPEWKQRNLTARTSELLRIKSDRALTTEEQAELDAMQAEWDLVKSVRTFSDGLEADIDAGTITTEAEIDGAAWP